MINEPERLHKGPNQGSRKRVPWVPAVPGRNEDQPAGSHIYAKNILIFTRKQVSNLRSTSHIINTIAKCDIFKQGNVPKSEHVDLTEKLPELLSKHHYVTFVCGMILRIVHS